MEILTMGFIFGMFYQWISILSKILANISTIFFLSLILILQSLGLNKNPNVFPILVVAVLFSEIIGLLIEFAKYNLSCRAQGVREGVKSPHTATKK